MPLGRVTPLPIVLPDDGPPGRWRRPGFRLLAALGAAVVLAGGWLLLDGGPDQAPATRFKEAVAGMSSSIRFGSSPATEDASPATEDASPATEGASPATEGASPATEGASPATEDASRATGEVAAAPTQASPPAADTSAAREGPPPRRVETSPDPTETSPAREAAPPPREASAAAGEALAARADPSPSPGEFDPLLQAAERSIVGYQQRQSDFDLTRIGCYELAAGYARLDADVVSLAVWRSSLDGPLAPRQESAYQEVMRRAAAADRLFDRTGCPRP